MSISEKIPVFTQTYVAGFCFNADRTKLALVKKLKPAWQHNKFNAIGGKIEVYDASPAHAMRREFIEEAGVDIAENLWQEKVVLHRPGVYHVHFFVTFADTATFDAIHTVEAEEIHKIDLAGFATLDVIDNLRWLVPLCLDKGISNLIMIEEKP